MSEPGHALPPLPSPLRQVCRRDSDMKRAERGAVAWPKPQDLCPGTRRIPGPPRALGTASISHPSMGNEARSVQWAVHTRAITTKLITTRPNKRCQSLLLISGCWNMSIGNGGLSPTLHKWRRSELERQWVVSPWTAPLELHRMQPLLDGFRAPQYSQCSQTAKGLTSPAINLLCFHSLSFQTLSQLFIVSILSSWTDETSTSHGKKQAGGK